MVDITLTGWEFFSRTDILRILQKRVNALKEGYRQNIALTGQHLSGKTSILHHFLSNLNDKSILPIYVEVTDEPFVYFSKRFMGSLLYNFLKSRGLEPIEDFELLVKEARNFIPHTTKAIVNIQDLVAKRNYDEAYSELFNLTNTIKEETGKSCVIILDEFHNLALLKVKQPFRNFGKKIMIQKDTMYVVTSSQVTTVKKILNEKLSLLFGNFEIVQIGGFSVKDSISFLDKRLKYIRVPKEYKNFIISFTDGNPFYLDVISQTVKDIVMPLTFKRVTQEVLIQAITKTVFESKGCIHQCLYSLLEPIKLKKSPEVYISILFSIASGFCRTKEIARQIKKRAGDVSKYANELIEMNILYKNGSFYKFIDRMLGFWMKYVYQKKRSAIISYLPDRVNIFYKEMAELLNNFVSEEQKGLFERIADLFGILNNETIFISGKECRLRSFSSVDIRRFGNNTLYILAKTKDRYWLISLAPEKVQDIDIIEFVERCKALKLKIQRKILVTLSGIDLNAQIVAKEENIWIWNLETINNLMSLYGKERIIGAVYNYKDDLLLSSDCLSRNR